MLKNKRISVFLAASAILVPLFILGFDITKSTQKTPIGEAASISAIRPYIASQQIPELYPLRNWKIDSYDVNARSALAIEMPAGKVLYEKNIFEQHPIASITKLLTAITAVRHMDLAGQVTITLSAIETPDDSAHLRAGQTFSVRELLYAILLESSNDAAVALAEHYGTDFTAVMNEEFKSITGKGGSFIEPTGLSSQNMAAAVDVAKMLYAAAQDEILAKVMHMPDYFVYRGGLITHKWENSNELLLRNDVVGGKTGFTDEAGESMAVLAISPSHSNIITVVLNAEDRELQTEELLDWVHDAYIWK